MSSKNLPSLILDFDGTLFNTLPAHFKIIKKKLSHKDHIIKEHYEYILRNQHILQNYAKTWKTFLIDIFKFYELALISESRYEILKLYLKFFDLLPFFSKIYGEQFNSNNDRRETLEILIKNKKLLPNFFVSDNKSDQYHKIENLFLIPSNEFFSSDYQHFANQISKLREKLTANH